MFKCNMTVVTGFPWVMNQTEFLLCFTIKWKTVATISFLLNFKIIINLFQMSLTECVTPYCRVLWHTCHMTQFQFLLPPDLQAFISLQLLGCQSISDLVVSRKFLQPFVVSRHHRVLINTTPPPPKTTQTSTQYGPLKLKGRISLFRVVYSYLSAI